MLQAPWCRPWTTPTTADISWRVSAPAQPSTCHAVMGPASSRSCGRRPRDPRLGRVRSTTGIHYRRITAMTSTKKRDGWTSSPVRPGTWATMFRSARDHVGSAAAQAIMNANPAMSTQVVHGVAEGWWQGHEAWSNLCAGARMASRTDGQPVAVAAAPRRARSRAYFLAEGAAG